MAGPQTRPREDTRDVFTSHLVKLGFTSQQAQDVLRITDQLRRGETPRLTPEQMVYVPIINAINRRWAEVAPRARGFTDITEDQAKRILTAAPRPGQALTSEDVFMTRLMEHGYTWVQSREVMDITQRLRAGENVRLRPDQGDLTRIINAINEKWSEVSGGTRRLSQLTAAQTTRMFATMLYPRAPAVPELREAPQPAPVRTFVYEVMVAGERYTVQTGMELMARGMSSVQSSRLGQLRDVLTGSTGGVLAITTPDGRAVRPGSPEYTEFATAYIRAYAAMVRDPSSDAIHIAAIRRRGERGTF